MIYPLISVIVPTKNEEKNIVRCLLSIKNQDYKGKVEIILVDNHSSDKTIQLAKKFTPYVFIAGNERSQQRNFGAKKSHGKWLLFLDADMELSCSVISECFFLTQHRFFPPVVAIFEKAVGSTFWSKALALEKICNNYASWLIAARFFPRKYFLKIGGYDTTLVAGEDWDLSQRFQAKGSLVTITKESFVLHYEPPTPLSAMIQKEFYYMNNMGLYAKKQPLAFSYQGSLLYRLFIWVRSWNILIKHPIYTCGFLLYKFVIWIMWMNQKKKF